LETEVQGLEKASQMEDFELLFELMLEVHETTSLL
jgi:hypothetical protein